MNEAVTRVRLAAAVRDIVPQMVEALCKVLPGDQQDRRRSRLNGLANTLATRLSTTQRLRDFDQELQRLIRTAEDGSVERRLYELLKTHLHPSSAWLKGRIDHLALPIQATEARQELQLMVSQAAIHIVQTLTDTTALRIEIKEKGATIC